MTILETLQWANNKLKKAEIDSPMLDAEILLAHVLGVTKAWLFAHIGEDLKPHHEEQFRLLIDRRVKREPVAYLIGKQSFYGQTFIVNNATLIPRPETELLVETAIHDIERQKKQTLVIDIGTGSGAIAITVARECEIPVVAIDIDEHALETAKENATAQNAKNITFLQGSILEPIVEFMRSENVRLREEPFTHLVICANLPYLTTKQMQTLQPEVQHEPKHALIAGDDGLDFYRMLFHQLQQCRAILPRSITVLIEIDPEQEQNAQTAIRELMHDAHITTKQDLHHHTRVLVVQ